MSSPYINHFLQPDTITPGGPQGLNRYSYAGNRPINFNDPTGHLQEDDSDGGSCRKNLACHIGKFKGWWKGSDVGYTGSGWGHGPRRWLAKQMGLSSNIHDVMPFFLNSLLQSDSVTLVEGSSSIERYGSGEGLGLVKSDPAFLSFQNGLISSAKRNPKYGIGPFSLRNNFDNLEFGGERGSWNPTDKATQQVVTNDLTWIVRHATIGGRVDVAHNGKIQMTYTLYDVADLRPENNRSDLYENVVRGLGFLWHDILGANDKMTVNANWTQDIP